MSDVARAAGVSVMTVSYAYNHPDRVAPATREKVLAAAARLGYPGPDAAARNLRRGRTGNLGVVLGEHLTYAFADDQATSFLAGVAEVCTEHGLGLTLIPITGGPADVDRVREAAVDGFVVWTTVDDDPVLAAVAASALPAVVHGGPAGGRPHPGADHKPGGPAGHRAPRPRRLGGPPGAVVPLAPRPRPGPPRGPPP